MRTSPADYPFRSEDRSAGLHPHSSGTHAGIFPYAINLSSASISHSGQTILPSGTARPQHMQVSIIPDSSRIRASIHAIVCIGNAHGLNLAQAADRNDLSNFIDHGFRHAFVRIPGDMHIVNKELAA